MSDKTIRDFSHEQVLKRMKPLMKALKELHKQGRLLSKKEPQ